MLHTPRSQQKHMGPHNTLVGLSLPCIESSHMASLFAGLKGVFTPATIQIAMEDEATRTKVRKPHSTDTTEYLLYSSKDPVKGSVTVTPLPNRKLDYQQIQCEFTGIIEVFGEKTQSNNFITVTKDLDQEGVITSSKTFQFDFTSIKKEYETYYGVNVNLRFATLSYILLSFCHYFFDYLSSSLLFLVISLHLIVI